MSTALSSSPSNPLLITFYYIFFTFLSCYTYDTSFVCVMFLFLADQIFYRSYTQATFLLMLSSITVVVLEAVGL